MALEHLTVQRKFSFHTYCKSDLLCLNKSYKVNILEAQADKLGLTSTENSYSAITHDNSLLQKLVADQTLKMSDCCGFLQLTHIMILIEHPQIRFAVQKVVCLPLARLFIPGCLLV